MYRQVITFFLLLVLVLFSLSSQAAGNLYSDLRDVAEWSNKEYPHARLIVQEIKENPERFFAATPKEVYGIELYDDVRVQHGEWVFPVIANFTFDRKNLYFRKFLVYAREKITNVTLVEEIPLAQTQFSATVGLVSRALYLNDERHGIKKLFPVGVGGIDAVTRPGQVQVVTPLIPGGSLRKRYVISRRTKPYYFQGKPFLRVSRPDGKGTAIGLHIQQNKVFIRGFDSHGCMRLRNKDLREMYQLVTKGPQDAMPLEIQFYVPETKNDHPYPLFTKYYKAVKNYGTLTRPKIRRDGYGLVIMEKIAGVPDIQKIIGSAPPMFLP